MGAEEGCRREGGPGQIWFWKLLLCRGWEVTSCGALYRSSRLQPLAAPMTITGPIYGDDGATLPTRHQLEPVAPAARAAAGRDRREAVEGGRGRQQGWNLTSPRSGQGAGDPGGGDPSMVGSAPCQPPQTRLVQEQGTLAAA